MACDVGMGGVSYHDMSSAFPTVCETWHILDTEMESASVGIQVGKTLVHTAEKCKKKVTRQKRAWLLASSIPCWAHIAEPKETSPEKTLRCWGGVQSLILPACTGATDLKGQDVLRVPQCL